MTGYIGIGLKKAVAYRDRSISVLNPMRSLSTELNI